MESISLDFIHQSFTGRLYPALIKLVWFISLVIGVFLVAAGLKKLVDAGNGKAPTYTPGFMYVIAGMLLVYLEPSILISNQTLFGTPAPLVYSGRGADPVFRKFVDLFVGAIFIIGLISFVRGVMALRFNGSHQQGLPNSYGKCLLSIVFGVLAMNVLYTTELVAKTIGYVIR